MEENHSWIEELLASIAEQDKTILIARSLLNIDARMLKC